MRTARAPIDDLRRVIALLPERTRVAMLEAVCTEPIITGGYARRGGGVCPMLAAHRRGGRTDLLAFARAWDRFTGARHPRAATARELRALADELESSLVPGPADGPLGAAVAAHQALVRRRKAAEAAVLGVAWLTAGRPGAETAPRGRCTRETGAGAP
jgi:hypothetical protein